MGLPAENERPDERVYNFLQSELSRCKTDTEREVVTEFLQGMHTLYPQVSNAPMKTGERPLRRKRFRNWNRDIRENAFQMIRDGVHESEIAELTGIPRATIHNWRMKGKPYVHLVPGGWEFVGPFKQKVKDD